MAESKPFPALDVLSTITGRLMGDIGGVYLVLNYMTGENLYTHQLPRVCREAQPVIVALHPELQAAVDEAGQVNPENVQVWRDRWLDRYGAEISVPRLTADQHERIDAMSELAEMVHPSKIIVVKP